MRLSLLLLFFLSLLGAARADSLTPIALAKDVRFDQNLGAQVPLDLPFVSDEGAPVHLGDYFHQRPVLLVLDYYRCPNLCSLILNSMVTSLQALTFNAGERFDVVVVSIDPTDTPAVSAQKKMAYLDRYERPQTERGWHFLTGQEPAIHALADTVGFRYAYDPATRQYAHPSGMIVLTPEGKVSRYFFGIEFPPAQIRDALTVAAGEKINSPVYDFLLLCCQYNPLQGKYGPLIFVLFRWAGILTVLILAAFIGRSLYLDAHKPTPESKP
jgi:protein SCO1/2